MAAVEEEEEEEEDMEEGEEEEEDDDNDREEDAAVAMTARMDHQPTERVRRASAPAMMASTPTSTFRPAPSQWSVEEVTAFITTLPGTTGAAKHRPNQHVQPESPESSLRSDVSKSLDGNGIHPANTG